MNEFRSQIFGGRRSSKDRLLGKKRPRGAMVEAGLQSVTVPRSESRTSDTRGADRHRLSDERVTLTHRRKKHEVELVNLSGGGAMVAGEFSPRLWDPVQLHLADGASLDCVVCWAKADRVGLQFAPGTQIDCSPEELRSLIREVVARSFPDLVVEVGGEPEEQGPAASAAPAAEQDHRRDNRIPLIWNGMVHFDFTSTRVRLRNLSRTGALIECDLPLPVGSEPLLDIGESGSVFATVTWRRENQIGLEFKTPFDLALLSRSRPDVVPLWREGGIEGYEPAADSGEVLTHRELRDRLEGYLKR